MSDNKSKHGIDLKDLEKVELTGIKPVKTTGKRGDGPGVCVNGREALLLQKYDDKGGMFLRFRTGEGFDDFIDAEIDYPDMGITIRDSDAYLKQNSQGDYYVDVSHKTLGRKE